MHTLKIKLTFLKDSVHNSEIIRKKKSLFNLEEYLILQILNKSPE
jgi:hypothetical protein